jgi:hypothetical protein
MDHFIDALDDTESRLSDIIEDCEKSPCHAKLDYRTYKVTCPCGKSFDEYGFSSENT